MKKLCMILVCCFNFVTMYSKPAERKMSAEDVLYWQAQQKYLVDPKEFFGPLPEDLETFVVMFQNKEEFLKVGLRKSSNFIFYGPPGTGKTYIASIFAQRLAADFMYVQGTELTDMWQGAGIRKPAELFERARRHRDDTGKPVVMFIDEIDTILGSRDNPNIHESTLQLLGSLLKELGAEVNNNIFVIIATNRKDNLDAALIRSGRFDHHIYFDIPDQQQRKDFMKFLIEPYRHLFHPDINWDLIAYNADDFTYADLRKVIDDLKRNHVLRKLQKKAHTEKIMQTNIEQRYPALLAPIIPDYVDDSDDAEFEPERSDEVAVGWTAHVQAVWAHIIASPQLLLEKISGSNKKA